MGRTVITGLVVVRALTYVAMGANFVHDDLNYVTFLQLGGGGLLDGSLHSTGLLDSVRPGMWVTYEVVYRLAGQSPVLMSALLTGLNVAVANVLFAVLSRFFRRATALAIVVIWVVMPNHNAITVWGATAQVLVGLLLFLGGVYALCRGRWPIALLALPASVWCYELLGPPALVAPLLVPSALLLLPADRPVRPWQRGVVVAVCAAAVLRSVLDPIFPQAPEFPDIGFVWSGHFGDGLSAGSSLAFGAGIPVLLAFGVFAALWSFVRGPRGREDGPTLVVVGLVIGVTGLAGTFYFPPTVGEFDRLLAASTIGAAIIVVGLLRWVWRGNHSLVIGLSAILVFLFPIEVGTGRDRLWSWVLIALVVAGATVIATDTRLGLQVGPTHAVAVVLTIAFVALCTYGQFVSLRSWSTAGADADALLQAMRGARDPHATFVIDQPPVRRGVEGVDPLQAQVLYLRAYPDGTGTLVIGAEDPPTDETTTELRWSDLVDTSDAVECGWKSYFCAPPPDADL